MKQIQNYYPAKYATTTYAQIDEGIYATEGVYSTSLCFLQETELGEGTSAADMATAKVWSLLGDSITGVSM